VIAGTLKASYDLGMLKMFVNTKLEGDKAPSADVANIGGHGERNESRLAAENSQDGEDLELENVKP
jgi:hypothetical protein